jgi:cell division protein FtsB
MTLGYHERRKRRRFWWRVFKRALVLALVIAAFVFAYEIGSDLARSDATRLEQEMARLSEEIGALQQENADLREALTGAEIERERWRQRYADDVPSGVEKELLDLVQKRLAAGVAPDRLAFVIGAARNARSCDDAPVTKRFVVQTPLTEGANDSVRFADGTITVTGQGETASDALGNPEAWFDPAAPVTLRFTRLGGESSEASGKLPLHHSVVVGGGEYRFTITAGALSFVQVTGDKCRYP